MLLMLRLMSWPWGPVALHPDSRHTMWCRQMWPGILPWQKHGRLPGVLLVLWWWARWPEGRVYRERNAQGTELQRSPKIPLSPRHSEAANCGSHDSAVCLNWHKNASLAQGHRHGNHADNRHQLYRQTDRAVIQHRKPRKACYTWGGRSSHSLAFKWGCCYRVRRGILEML